MNLNNIQKLVKNIIKQEISTNYDDKMKVEKQ